MTIAKEIRAEFGGYLLNKMNDCQSGEEQFMLLEEFIRVGIGTYVFRVKGESVAVQIVALQMLSELVQKLIAENADKLLDAHG